MAFGSASTTSPSNSTFSSFAKRLQPQIVRTFVACRPFGLSPSPSPSAAAPPLRRLDAEVCCRHCLPACSDRRGGLSDAPVYTSGPGVRLALPAGWRAVLGRRLRRRLVLVGVELRPAGVSGAV